jgi:hypothetical protein
LFVLCVTCNVQYFLFQRNKTGSLPIIDQDEIPLSRRLELVQNHLRGIWKVWYKDYLNQLQIRSKSTGCQPNLAINDIVLMKDQRCPPYRWPLAEIIHTYTASDGLVRVVEVKTANATYCRSIYSTLSYLYLFRIKFL